MSEMKIGVPSLGSAKFSLKLLLFVSLGLLVPVLLLVAQSKGYFRLQNISIELSSVSPVSYQIYADQTRLDLNKLIGEDLWALNLGDLETQLKSRSWVQSVRLGRVFPNQLNIHIDTKPPVALVLDRKGGLHPLAITAELLPSIRPDEAPQLPVIQDARAIRDLDLRSRVAKLLSELPTEGRLTMATIDQISFTKSGQILIQHKSNRSTIHLGEDEIPLRSARVARVLDYLDHNQIVWKEINADFQKKVVVKKNTAESPDLHIAQ